MTRGHSTYLRSTFLRVENVNALYTSEGLEVRCQSGQVSITAYTQGYSESLYKLSHAHMHCLPA